MSAPHDFRALFGREATTRAAAPGRVNLIGEHTDYNGGFVLPMAIAQRTHVEVAILEEPRVRAFSVQAAADGIVEWTLGQEARSGRWVDYVQGLTQTLLREGRHLGGFELRVDSDVPLGGGLSSSASLSVAVLRALDAAFALGLDEMEIPRIARAAETGLVGAPVGVMDPIACHLADERSAILLDTRTLAWRRIPLPERFSLAIVSSGIHHRLAGGEYAARRAECEEAARLLGVPFLCDLGGRDLPSLRTLPPLLARRAQHVVTENARVLEFLAALESGDLADAGSILDASHASLRNHFEVSLPEIDLLAGLLRGRRGVYGARLTGGGFGGSVIALCESPRAAAAAAREATLEYVRRTHAPGRAIAPRV